MRFTKSYEPGEFEPQIYAEWEKSGVFAPRFAIADAPARSSANSALTDARLARRMPNTARFDAPVALNSLDDHRGGLSAGDCYSIVMPPPNANGNLHIGHGLTIALEDSLARYYRLRGKSTWYIPGADHAGFETWVVYEKALEKEGKSRFDYSRDELYAQVWKFVEEQRGNMELQLRALGASCAWEDLTFTLDENVVARVYQTFEKMWKDGMIYRGEKLVNFCPKHLTAFADIEVAHEDEEGKLWEIAYSDEIIVSTTRPETLFGDVAVAVNPNDERYKDLVGKFVKLPLTEREIPIIADEHADPEYGTGAVKITPAHDFDDFEVGERHGLARIQVIGEDGLMTEVAGAEFAGLTTEEARKKVLKLLKDQGLLRGEKKIKHAVAHCYKCGTVLEPMLKAQWFVDVERLAKMAIERLEKGEIKFTPAGKKDVLVNYLRGLKDWNISRQIPWGIPIPMFHRDRNTEEDEFSRATSSLKPVTAPSRDAKSSSVRCSASPRISSENSSLCEHEAPEWIFDARTNLAKIEVGGVKYYRDEDTFDTWFSSAHWPIVCTDWTEVQPGRENPYYPLNVMETGADLLFAWVARMIMMGVYVTGEVPFREVYLHGMVLDAHGKKMSKSKGNVINPMELVTKYGSDAFRLGILRGRSAGMNQAFSENSVIAGRNLCNKLWNIARLVNDIVGEDGDSGNGYTTENMGEDWICRELTKCKEDVEVDMANYRFSEAVETLYGTIWDKYADWFIESQKIYKNVPLLKVTLEMILKMLHPFAPFVTEAIWQSLSWTEGMLVTEKWPCGLTWDAVSAEEFERLMVIVSEIRRVSNELSGASGGKKWTVLYDNDALMDDNSLLVAKLANAAAVISCEGQPRGLRLALVGHEVYLDVDAGTVKKYKDKLEERVLAVGRELDGLNARMMNPSYVERAPAELVKQTRDGIREKEGLIERLKGELKVIE